MIYVQLACNILGGISSLIVIITWGDVAWMKAKAWVADVIRQTYEYGLEDGVKCY